MQTCHKRTVRFARTLLFKVAAVATTLTLSSCATLDENECKNADWYIIGLEDGSKGRQAAYLGNHRKACAEHQVTPNVERYEQGRENGLLQYCTPQNGYQLGRRGSYFPAICPAELNGTFQTAYNSGKSVYKAERSVKAIERDIISTEEQIERLQKSNMSIEAGLIHGFGSAVERKESLEKFKTQKDRISHLERRLEGLQERKVLRQERFQSLVESVSTQYR